MAFAPWLPPKTSSVGFGMRSDLSGDLEKCFTHRYACDFSVMKILCRFFEVNRRARNPPRHQAVGKAGHHVRLEGQGWSSLQDGREHGGAGSVSADPDHDVGTKFSEDAARIPDRTGKIEQGLQPRFKADFVESTDLDKPQRKSSCRNQAVLDTARRTDKQDLGGIPLLQFLGNGQRGNHVPASAAARQNRSHPLTINRKLRRRRTLG